MTSRSTASASALSAVMGCCACRGGARRAVSSPRMHLARGLLHARPVRMIEVHRVNRDAGHDTGCCSFCGHCGRGALGTSIADGLFGAPPQALVNRMQGA
jgi:hypothetical protein